MSQSPSNYNTFPIKATNICCHNFMHHQKVKALHYENENVPIQYTEIALVVTRKTITCATCYIRPCFILVNANIEWPIKHAFSCIYV